MQGRKSLEYLKQSFLIKKMPIPGASYKPFVEFPFSPGLIFAILQHLSP